MHNKHKLILCLVAKARFAYVQSQSAVSRLVCHGAACTTPTTAMTTSIQQLRAACQWRHMLYKSVHKSLCTMCLDTLRTAQLAGHRQPEGAH